MEEERNLNDSQPGKSYAPRPAWQIWAARIALAVFLALIAMYYVNIARGGR